VIAEQNAVKGEQGIKITITLFPGARDLNSPSVGQIENGRRGEPSRGRTGEVERVGGRVEKIG
jgi:hypothetical protein